MQSSKEFKVELVFEGAGDAESDPSLSVKVMAADESAALATAKDILQKENPDMNFMKIWCWHIEALDGYTS